MPRLWQSKNIKCVFSTSPAYHGFHGYNQSMLEFNKVGVNVGGGDRGGDRGGGGGGGGGGRRIAGTTPGVREVTATALRL